MGLGLELGLGLGLGDFACSGYSDIMRHVRKHATQKPVFCRVRARVIGFGFGFGFGFGLGSVRVSLPLI